MITRHGVASGSARLTFAPLEDGIKVALSRRSCTRRKSIPE